MHKQKHLFETILAKLQSGIIVLDPEGRIIMVNDYIAECCGLSVEQFPGKSLNAISPILYEKILTGRTTGEIVTNVCGSEKPIGFNLSPLTDESGNPIGTIIMKCQQFSGHKVKQLSAWIQRRAEPHIR